MEEKLSDTLKRAKAVLLDRGWYQGDYVNERTGEVCVMGAVNVAEGGDPRCNNEDEDEEETDIESFMHGLAVRFWYHDIGSWNDAKGRTPEQVLAFMDYAIALAESRESATKADAVDPVGERVTG